MALIKKHRGTVGEPAVIRVNGSVVGLNYPIGANDEIELTIAKHGVSPVVTIEALLMNKEPFDIYINEHPLQLPYRITVNGHKKEENYVIQNKDHIVIEANYSITELLQLSDIHQADCLVYVNHQIVSYDYMVKPQDKVTIQMKKKNNELGEGIASEDVAVTKIMPNIPRRMKVIVNEQEIILQGKDSYVFVDIFDYIDFDLRNPKGKIVCLVNGKAASYMENIDSGDQIEVYWDK